MKVFTLEGSGLPQVHGRRPVMEHVVVVVPAHNEEAGIGATIRSIREATRWLPPSVTSEIVVVADRCGDGTTAEAASALGDSGSVLTVESGNVGAARRAGVKFGLRSCGEAIARTWIASTDADTLTPRHWLTRQLTASAQGYVGVAGVVELAESSILREKFLGEYFDDAGAAPSMRRPRSHPHVHGANIGFRADSYQRVGGWRHLRTGEDHDLWNRLRSIGPVLSTTALTVCTSDRLVGRAPLGFACDLRALATKPPQVDRQLSPPPLPAGRA